jgi:hypothetical protein
VARYCTGFGDNRFFLFLCVVRFYFHVYSHLDQFAVNGGGLPEHSSSADPVCVQETTFYATNLLALNLTKEIELI